MTPKPYSEAEIDRFCELAALGASFASTALGSLIAVDVHDRPPRLCRPADPTPAERFATGIVFEVEGDFDGLVAIVLPESRSEVAVERMLGRADASTELAESALRELGNIIASHTVSAIADAMGVTVLLSIPMLARREADVVLGALIAERSAPLRIEVDLCGPDGSSEAVLVFVPERRKPGTL
jgi:chemotaxis protein CheC